jgi:hypothetical protein
MLLSVPSILSPSRFFTAFTYCVVFFIGIPLEFFLQHNIGYDLHVWNIWCIAEELVQRRRVQVDQVVWIGGVMSSDAARIKDSPSSSWPWRGRRNQVSVNTAVPFLLPWRF